MGNSLGNLLYNKEDEYRKYGWKLDTPDQRDKIYQPNDKYENNNIVDLRAKCPGVYNQYKLGSCTANAIAAAYEFNEIKQNEDNIFIPSRLFIYYNEREIENTVKYDSGASIRDGIKTINKIGVCDEDSWPYDITQFTVKPSENCYSNAEHHKSVKYSRIQQNISHMQNCIKSGLPFVFGFGVYESFESDQVTKTGIMPIPAKDEKLLGGHAVMAVGYDDIKKVFIIRNSWGMSWGDRGYFYMPYSYIANPLMSSDFWCIEKVNDESN